MSSLLVLRTLVATQSASKFLSACPTIYKCNCQELRKRFYSQKESKLTEVRHGADVSTDVRPLGEKIKENTKTASYMGVILLGIGVTGVMFYAIFRELFSSTSPNSVYSEALDKVINDPRVQDLLGVPIKGYGEETRRRRRTHAAHTVFQRNGVNCMRMQFYIQGIRNKATVHLEMKQNQSGYYDYRYLFVELNHYPKTTVILEDNRAMDAISSGKNLNDNSWELKP